MSNPTHQEQQQVEIFIERSLCALSVIAGTGFVAAIVRAIVAIVLGE